MGFFFCAIEVPEQGGVHFSGGGNIWEVVYSLICQAANSLRHRAAPSHFGYFLNSVIHDSSPIPSATASSPSAQPWRAPLPTGARHGSCNGYPLPMVRMGCGGGQPSPGTKDYNTSKSYMVPVIFVGIFENYHVSGRGSASSFLARFAPIPVICFWDEFHPVLETMHVKTNRRRGQ